MAPAPSHATFQPCSIIRDKEKVLGTDRCFVLSTSTSITELPVTFFVLSIEYRAGPGDATQSRCECRDVIEKPLFLPSPRPMMLRRKHGVDKRKEERKKNNENKWRGLGKGNVNGLPYHRNTLTSSKSPSQMSDMRHDRTIFTYQWRARNSKPHYVASDYLARRFVDW